MNYVGFQGTWLKMRPKKMKNRDFLDSDRNGRNYHEKLGPFEMLFPFSCFCMKSFGAS